MNTPWNGTLFGLQFHLDRPFEVRDVYNSLPSTEVEGEDSDWTCSMTDTTFLLTAYEHDFVTRNMGKKMRGRLLEFDASAPAGVELTIDVSGIVVLTPSFADEFFAKTVIAMGLNQFRKRFRIVGVTDEIKLLISKVTKIRLAQSVPQTTPSTIER